MFFQKIIRLVEYAFLWRPVSGFLTDACMAGRDVVH